MRALYSKIILTLSVAMLAGVAQAATVAHAATQAPKKASEPLGKYTVQVAAYDDQVQAKAFVSGLKEKGYRAFTVPVQIKGRNWYRIGIGLFPTESEAKTYRTQLLTKMNLSDAIIREID